MKYWKFAIKHIKTNYKNLKYLCNAVKIKIPNFLVFLFQFNIVYEAMNNYISITKANNARLIQFSNFIFF